MTRDFKGHVVLVQFSYFSLGRGLYLAEALHLLGLKVTIVTNKQVYTSARATFV